MLLIAAVGRGGKAEYRRRRLIFGGQGPRSSLTVDGTLLLRKNVVLGAKGKTSQLL